MQLSSERNQYLSLGEFCNQWTVSSQTCREQPSTAFKIQDLPPRSSWLKLPFYLRSNIFRSHVRSSRGTIKLYCNRRARKNKCVLERWKEAYTGYICMDPVQMCLFCHEDSFDLHFDMFSFSPTFLVPIKKKEIEVSYSLNSSQPVNILSLCIVACSLPLWTWDLLGSK